MQANYDPQSDTLTLLWSDAPIQESDSDKPGIILDYDAEGNVIGVEILNASKRINLQELAQAQ
jgi:uncharacterized protein YuzE